jgi:hypothetical protein
MPQSPARLKEYQFLLRQTPERKAYMKEYAAARNQLPRVIEKRNERKRSRWQRIGSGAHAYRVACWSAFFDSLNDNEQLVAAYVMLALKGFDEPTRGVVMDRDFDYCYLGEAFA